MTRFPSAARSALRRLRTSALPVPGQSAGLAGIVAVLTAALVSVPLMVGSAEEGAWDQQVPGVVRWDNSFAERPLEELMAAFGDYRGDRVPVIVAGPLPDEALACHRR